MIPDSAQHTFKCRPPAVTFALLFGLLSTTLPQFFLPELYDSLTGTLFGLEAPHFLFLNVFSHSPSILLPHALGNTVVLLFFGTISERVLGSPRFAALSLATLAVTLATAYWRELSSVHGISGVIWGFHVPVLFLLFASAEKHGLRSVLRRPWAMAALCLFLFDFLGLHLLEVTLLGLRPFENFGQVLHLVSVVVATPFAFAWRGEIERAAVPSPRTPAVAPGRSLERRSLSKTSVIALGFTLLLNLAGTTDAIYTTLTTPSQVRYSLEPPSGTPPEAAGTEIHIAFSEPMLERQPNLRRRSIRYDEPPVPDVSFRWVGTDELILGLSRQLTENEAILLEFDVYRAGPRGIPLPTSVTVRHD